MGKKKNTASGERLYKAFIYVVLIALAVTIIVPVAWVFMASIKENSEFYGNPWALPKGFYWQNFVDAWNSANMGLLRPCGCTHTTIKTAHGKSCPAICPAEPELTVKSFWIKRGFS